MEYVTYDESGKLTGSYNQDLHPSHVAAYIEVSAEQRENWTMFQANAERGGLEHAVVVPDVALLKSAKNTQINLWRATANTSTFPFQGKLIACDQLSRSDIDGVANSITLVGDFPEGWQGAWKTTSNEYVFLPTVESFKEFYSAMTAQGAANFAKAQSLKAALASATTQQEVDAIIWE